MISYVVKDDVRALVGTHQLKAHIAQHQAIHMAGKESVGWCRSGPAWLGVVGALLAVGGVDLFATSPIPDINVFPSARAP